MSATASVKTRWMGIPMLCIGLLLGPFGPAASAQERPRLVVLTDFFKDPDDKQSMIRLLTCANEFDIEGLIATSLAYGDGAVHPEWIEAQIDDYAAVIDNLRQHERPGYPYPSPESLKAVVRRGAPVIRKLVGTAKGFPVPYPPGTRDSRSCDPPEKWIGPGKDSEASEHLIHVVDRDDPRPVWIVVWGGPMDLAQALWKVRTTRSPEDAARFVAKLRVFQVSWQDTGAVWIWNEFPDLFLIQCTDAHRGMHSPKSAAWRDDAWVDQNIRDGHGDLGAGYPKAGNTKGIKEGDTPSFLHLLARGLSDPEHPEWGGWGGRYVRLDDTRRFYVDAQDQHPGSQDEADRIAWTVGRWSDATSNDLAARMDWCVRSNADANHPPVVVVAGDPSREVLAREAVAGQTFSLDATGTQDPDGDRLEFHWWQYREAGSYGGTATIDNAREVRTSLLIPSVNTPETIHVVLSVTDQGEAPLTSYRRVIVTVRPPE